jgi:hypothetical protein
MKGGENMIEMQEKKPRMMRLTDETHELFKKICIEEDTTTEGALKRLIAQWIIGKSKEEK